MCGYKWKEANFDMMEVMRAWIGRWILYYSERLFDLQSRPGCSLNGYREKALPWKWSTGDRDVSELLCAGLQALSPTGMNYQ